MPDHVLDEGTVSRPVDRWSPLPLWAQVEADLSRRIEAGAFTAGFPTEAELCEDYTVSRHTVREALRRMRTTGLLESTRGRGTRLAPDGVEQSLGTLYSLFRAVERRGMVQRSVVLRLESTRNVPAASRLGLPPEHDLVVVERLRLADEEPLAHDEVFLPHDLAAPVLEADFTHAALYDELARRCGLRLTGGQEQISATLATPALRRELHAEEHPLLRVDRTGCVGPRIVETRVTHLRSDRFSLVSHWNRSALPST